MARKPKGQRHAPSAGREHSWHSTRKEATAGNAVTRNSSEGGININDLLLNLLLDAGLLLIPLAHVLYFEKKKPSEKKGILKEFGLGKKDSLEDFFLTGKILATLLVYSMLVSVLFFYAGINDFANVENTIGELISLSPLVVIYFLLIRVFLEEFFFRAFLVPRFGVIVSSLLFGFLHFGYNSVAEIIGAIVLGFVLAIAYKQNQRLVPNYVAHLLYNLMAIMLMAAI